MTDLQLAVDEYSAQHRILGLFYYSWFFAPDGEKKLHEWLRSLHKTAYDPDERIVFVQDQADQYDYSDDLGLCSQAIQNAIENIDISPCFVTVISTNQQISKELETARAVKNLSNDKIGSVVVAGSYVPDTPGPRDTFCVLPWAHLYIGPEGDVLPCCKGNLDHPLGYVDQDSLENIYNNANFVNLRQRMLEGKRTKECTHCWTKEDSGLPSPRLAANKKQASTQHIRQQATAQARLAPTHIDIRLNKLCNLKCRSCSPYYSSAIAQEIQEIYSVQWPALNNQKRKSALDEILRMLPSVEEIYFAGGEPLLASEHFAMISELLRLNHTKVNLLYNTNFMQLTYKNTDFLDLWQHFSQVTIGASLDACGTEAEYLRHGTVWNTIESNLSRLKQKNLPNLKLLITSTVGFLNIESLIKLQVSWSQQGLLPLESFEISQIIFDSYLSPQVLPYQHKQRLQHIIENHMEWLRSHKARTLADRWQQVLDYMWAADRSHLLPEFQRITTTTDQHRGESFHEIFPQFADLIPLANRKQSVIIST